MRILIKNFVSLKSFVALFLSITTLGVNASANTAIVTTINPLTFLIQEVAGNTTKVQTLLPNQSPHVSSLKPSQVDMLHHARILFYVNENLETFIPKISHQLKHAQLINIVEELDLDLLDSTHKHEEHDKHNEREHNEHRHHDEHKHDEHKGHEHHDEHDKHKGHDHDEHNHAGKDNHIWLSPAIAKQIVTLAAKKLSKTYPQHATTYQANAQTMLQKLNTLDTKLEKQLHTHSHNKFIIFHNAYNYLLHAYHLENNVVSTAKNSNLSLHKMLELQQVIKKEGVSCVFTDKKYNQRTMQKLIKNTNITHKTLNPLGDVNRDDYFSLIQNIAHSFKSCL
jgi:zinc transport system substrate-binding protein